MNLHCLDKFFFFPLHIKDIQSNLFSNGTVTPQNGQGFQIFTALHSVMPVM